MKKIISMITSLVMTMLLISAFSMTGSAEFVTENGITFAINKGIATVNDIEENITDLVIPEYIGENPVQKIYLKKKQNLKSITIPAFVKIVCTYECSNLTDFYVDDANENYCSVDGVLYSKDMKTLICYPSARTETTFKVPDGVEKIGERIDYEDTGFSYAVNLKEIILPEGLIEIGECAFMYCTFETIELPKSLTTIGNEAFLYNENLKEITIPENVIDVMHPFNGCDNLETIILLRETKFIPTSSIQSEDFSYLRLLYYENPAENTVHVYVPDNKFYEYNSMSDSWHNAKSKVIPFSEMPCEIIPGDVNYDQTVSTADVVIMQKSFAKSDGMKLMKAADMNGDGKLNVFDLILLKRKIQNM